MTLDEAAEAAFQRYQHSVVEATADQGRIGGATGAQQEVEPAVSRATPPAVSVPTLRYNQDSDLPAACAAGIVPGQNVRVEGSCIARVPRRLPGDFASFERSLSLRKQKHPTSSNQLTQQHVVQVQKGKKRSYASTGAARGDPFRSPKKKTRPLPWDAEETEPSKARQQEEQVDQHEPAPAAKAAAAHAAQTSGPAGGRQAGASKAAMPVNKKARRRSSVWKYMVSPSHQSRMSVCLLSCLQS